MKMASNIDFDKATRYAERIIRSRNISEKVQQDNQGKLKFIIYVIIALAIVCLLFYILYIAYTVKEPPDIFAEVNAMLNKISHPQVPPQA